MCGSHPVGLVQKGQIMEKLAHVFIAIGRWATPKKRGKRFCEMACIVEATVKTDIRNSQRRRDY